MGFDYIYKSGVLVFNATVNTKFLHHQVDIVKFWDLLVYLFNKF